jgi:hypothetical protein
VKSNVARGGCNVKETLPATSMSRSRRRARRRGAVLVEYALLLTFFAVPTIAGLTYGGLLMLQNYRASRNEVLRPFP